MFISADLEMLKPYQKIKFHIAWVEIRGHKDLFRVLALQWFCLSLAHSRGFTNLLNWFMNPNSEQGFGVEVWV